MRESQFPELFMPRHEKILELPLWRESDVVCAQEFYYGTGPGDENAQRCFDMYVRALPKCI